MDLRRLAASNDRAENSIMQTIGIAVSAILVATGLVSMPGIVNGGRDNAARQDLRSVVTAETFAFSSSGAYLPLSASDPSLASTAGVKLSQSAYRAGAGIAVVVAADGLSYTAYARSDSGALFTATSAATDPIAAASAPAGLALRTGS